LRVWFGKICRINSESAYNVCVRVCVIATTASSSDNKERNLKFWQ